MKRNLLGSTILALTISSGFAKDHRTDTYHLSVRFLDYVGLTAATRTELEAQAARILGAAGIAIDFTECYIGGIDTGSEGCTRPLGPTDLVLRVFQPKLAVKREQLGYAAMTPEGGAYITVFINPAQERARVVNLSNGAFLGHAVAHEIGHLLLGANSHSQAGVMRPAWRVVDEEWMAKGVLLFDASQASTMRKALIARRGR